jgi:hypothetical protein
MWLFDYSKPQPSLCDNCIHAGGGNGDVSFGGKSYIQRYCWSLKISIHSGGKQECEKYEEKK